MDASSERYAKSVGESPVTPSGANELEALRRHEEARRKRTSLTWCAVLLIVLSFTDVPMSPGTVAIRLGIAALAAAAGLNWERVAARWPVAVPVTLTAAMHGGYLGLVLLTGGLHGMNFSWSIVVPLACVVIVPIRAVPLLIISVLYAVGCLWAAHVDGLAGEALYGVASDYLASIAVAVFGAHQFRAMNEGETRVLASLQNVQTRAVESERMAVVGRLAAGVAHEINNPLAFVKANVSCLAEELEDRSLGEDELRQIAQETQVGLQRIESIVADLKGFARDTPLSRSSFDLSDAVTEAMRMTRLRTEDVANVEVVLPEGLPAVEGDRRRLVQVLVNLLVNAAEVLEPAARKDGTHGRILLRVRLIAGPSNGAGNEGRAAPARLSLTVHDSGPGIAPQHLAQMFTPFFTTKPVGKGTGLGLALSRSYMEQMGGRLDAGNHPDGGAEFRLELPLADPEDAGETAMPLDARIGIA